jgi:Tfp pilus assembly protein PilX
LEFGKDTMTKKNLPRRGQRGVSLLFALIALVALSLATLALVRTVDTGALMLGNIGFKQDATVTADQTAREALAWVKNNTASLDDDAPASGYYASTREVNADKSFTPVDVTGQQYDPAASALYRTRRLVDWSEAQDGACPYATSGTYSTCAIKSAAGATINGNKTRYVIFRLCAATGSANDELNNSCSKPLNSNGGASGRGALAYGSARFASTSGAYYRIVVRVLGARNTVSYTETIANFE